MGALGNDNTQEGVRMEIEAESKQRSSWAKAKVGKDAMNEATRAANAVLERFGHVIICSPRAALGEISREGEILPHVDDTVLCERVEGPLVILAESNLREWNRQREFLGLRPDLPDERYRYFRAVAE